MKLFFCLIGLIFFGIVFGQEEILDIVVIGESDTIKNEPNHDRLEAILDAKIKACEKSGLTLQMKLMDENFQLFSDYVESQTQKILIPGFKIVDNGYGVDSIYSIVLAGKIKIQSSIQKFVKKDLIESSLALREMALTTPPSGHNKYWGNLLAEDHRKENLECSALLALLAYKTNSSQEAKTALMDALTYVAQPRNLLPHNDYVISVIFSPDGKYIASCGWDGVVKIWNRHTYQIQYTLNHKGHPLGAVYGHNGKSLISYSEHIAILWNMSNGEKMNTFQTEEKIIAITFSRDSKKFAIVGEKTKILIGKVSRNEITAEVINESGSILAMAFSKNGNSLSYIAAISGNNIDKQNECFLKQAKTSIGKINKIFKLPMPDHSDPKKSVMVKSGAFSPKGSLFSTVTQDNTVSFWNSKSGKPIKTIQCQSSVQSIVFRKDSKVVAINSGFQSLVFNLKSGKELFTASHDDRIFTAAFSPDKTLIATGSQDGTVRIFNLTTQKEQKRLVPTKNIYSLSFSTDSRLLATTHQSTDAEVYAIGYDDLTEYACKEIGRSFTFEEWQTHMGDEPYSKICESKE